MAYISQRGAYWRAEIRRRGFKPAYRTFDTRQLAQQWARRTESEMDAGVYVDRSQAERTTLKEALERYRLEVLPGKKSPKQESGRIDRWLRTDLAHRSLANLRGADFARYRDTRRADGRAENTIRLELQLVSHLYETARKEWDMEGLLNPLRNIRKPSGSAARERRLQDGEYEAIRGYLGSSGNVYALPAFDLAIETSLRQGMLFAIQWEWVDLNARLIRIPAAWRRAGNKGVPAAIPLSRIACQVISCMATGRASPATGPILDTTPNAIRCLWARALKALEIGNLRWHDLRHEAASRFFEKGLHPMEVASITGHKSMQMLKRYTHLRAEDLVAKLDQQRHR
ncbi:tyrosine-type recombinase/integrase [Achromobacter deleyi]|uniref:tyrosine-type recombinase/integrase n=1 Tax=Achromobacter deleyi TaxID=1353891 RepID=UPI001490B674|nr:site-specific integrase [Achromobacter deleyi]QVQ24731.1 site-specific integrase [Achromobacter deleyi]UIP20269.1 site-specific integrase [Achromobacter deleyi]